MIQIDSGLKWMDLCNAKISTIRFTTEKNGGKFAMSAFPILIGLVPDPIASVFATNLLRSR